MLNCTDPQRILEILADTETSYTDYKATLEKSSAKDFRTGQSFPFSSMFSMDDRIADLKLKCLFQHVKRLELNPNGKFEMPERFKNCKQLDWKNTPLHLYIGNERFNIVKSCISYARENDVSIDFNVQDKEGKTPLLLSAKMGNIPLDVFRQMLTLENYNMPDSTGITPAMMACAMRRPDLLAALVQFHAEKVLVLNNFHIDHLSDEHKRQIQAFINQQQVKTKKSLGHFAIMRHGTEEELDKPDEYQQTVLNIAKSVGIDARRDKNALLNAERNDGGGQATIIEKEIGLFKQMLKVANLKTLDVKEFGLDPKDPDQFQLIFAKYSYRGDITVPTALLASKKNSFVLVSLTLGENAHLYKTMLQKIKSYAGISYAKSILSRTKENIDLLHKFGFDFSLRQMQGDKTCYDYLSFLTKEESQKFATGEDKEFLFPLVEKLRQFTS